MITTMWMLLTLMYSQSGGFIMLDSVRSDPYGPFTTEAKCMAQREKIVNYNGEPKTGYADYYWSDTVCIPVNPYPRITPKENQ